MAHDSSPLSSVEHDDPEPGSTWFIGLAGAIVLTALVLAISVLYFSTVEERTAEVVVDVPAMQLERLRTSQRQLISEYGRYTMLDPEGAEVSRLRMPVSRAMELIVSEDSFGSPSSPPPNGT